MKVHIYHQAGATVEEMFSNHPRPLLNTPLECAMLNAQFLVASYCCETVHRLVHWYLKLLVYCFRSCYLFHSRTPNAARFYALVVTTTLTTNWYCLADTVVVDAQYWQITTTTDLYQQGIMKHCSQSNKQYWRTFGVANRLQTLAVVPTGAIQNQST